MNLADHKQLNSCANWNMLTGSPFLTLSDVSFARDNRIILSDINLTVNYGDFIAVTGPNGGGKTTLLRIILGLLKPTTGTVSYFDTDGKEINPKVPGYLPQKNSIDSHFPITVKEVIASGLLSDKSLSPSEKATRIEQTLHLIQLEDFAKRPIGRLSGGQVQRTLLGRALVSQPSFLVMDEPLSYIDAHFEETLYRIMEQIAKKTTVVLVSHQMTHIGTIANRHIIVDRTLRECTHQHHYVQQDC